MPPNKRVKCHLLSEESKNGRLIGAEGRVTMMFANDVQEWIIERLKDLKVSNKSKYGLWPYHSL